MAIQTINIGNVVNDGLGDDLRSAFQKVNANFSELSSTLTINAANTDANGVGVFKGKNGTTLEFKRLVSGLKIDIDEHEDTLVINGTQPDPFSTIVVDYGLPVEASNSNTLTLQGGVSSVGGKNITVTAVDNVITVNSSLDLKAILTTLDFGPVTGPYENVIQYLCAISSSDFGTVSSPSFINLDLGSI